MVSRIYHDAVFDQFLYLEDEDTRFVITAYTALLSRQPNVKEHAESGLEQYVYKTITDLDQEEQDP